MNKNPCQDCAHYDPITASDDTPKGRHGWCSVKSIYPRKEPPGHIFPPNVKRAAHGQLGRPHIVRGDKVVSGCTLFQQK